MTYVAFDNWDFARYGVDRVVPTKGDDKLSRLQGRRCSRNSCRIPNNGGNIYWPDHFQAWGIDPKDITSGDLGKIFKVNMTQKDFYVDLVRGDHDVPRLLARRLRGEYAGLPRRHAGGYLRRSR
ncbi:MAG: hypothetical protein ACLUNO_09645 [Oscillospiraceae bacterium]